MEQLLTLPDQMVQHFTAELTVVGYYQIKPTFCSDQISAIYATTS